MKFTIASLALGLIGFTAAQLGDVPDCAKPCLEDYTSGSEIADCGQFDIECICSNDQFLDGIACCLDEECDEDGKSAAVKFAQQICGTQGVEVPDEVTCSENQQNEDEGDLASGLKVCLAGAAVAMAFAL